MNNKYEKEVRKLKFSSIYFGILGFLSMIMYFIFYLKFPEDLINLLFLVMGFSYLIMSNNDYNAKINLMYMRGEE